MRADGRVSLLTCAAGLVAVVMAGCGSPGAGGSSSAPASPGTSTGPSASVAPSGSASGGTLPAVTVAYVGGFAPAMSGTAVPAQSLWADGLIIQPGVQVASYPAPALPAVTAAQVDPAAMPRVLDTIASGLDGLTHDFGLPPTADVPSTVVTWRVGGGEEVWDAASLGVGDEQPSEMVSPEQVEARKQLTRVVDYLQALGSGTLDSVQVSPQETYLPAGWYVWSTPYQVVDSTEEPMRWPGPELAGGPDWSCQPVTGEQAQAVTEALSAAVSTTPWKSGGQRWSVAVRPILPGEPATCPIA